MAGSDRQVISTHARVVQSLVFMVVIIIIYVY